MVQHKTELKDEVCKEVEGVVKTLTEEMTDRKGAFNKEQADRKHENEMLGNKIESERREIQEELTVMKDDTRTIKTGSGGALSSAASTGFGLGSGTFAPPPLAARWQDGWVPRTIEVKGWVADWRTNTSKRFKDDQAKRILEEIEVAVATEVKGKSTEPSRKKNHVPWYIKTMVGPWFFHGTEMIIMIETLRNVREVLSDKNYKVNREILRANLELSLKENPWAKHRQFSTKPSLTRKEIKTVYGHRGVRFRSPCSQKLTQREETAACEMCCWVSRECARGQIYLEILEKVCGAFETQLFEFV